jgi:hypothetical protein
MYGICPSPWSLLVTVYFAYEYKRNAFEFEFIPHGEFGFRIRIREMPPCTKRNSDGDHLNIITLGDLAEIWLAMSALPKDIEAAKKQARDWARKLIRYYETGARFRYARDDAW